MESYFDDVPIEIIGIIVAHLDYFSLKDFINSSIVNTEELNYNLICDYKYNHGNDRYQNVDEEKYTSYVLFEHCLIIAPLTVFSYYNGYAMLLEKELLSLSSNSSDIDTDDDSCEDVNDDLD